MLTYATGPGENDNTAKMQQFTGYNLVMLTSIIQLPQGLMTAPEVRSHDFLQSITLPGEHQQQREQGGFHKIPVA